MEPGEKGEIKMYYDVMGFKEYEDYVEELTNKSKSKKSYNNRVLVPARRFLLGQTISSENPIAIPLAGYTIITPPKNEDEDKDKDNESAYQSFKIVQDSLKTIAGVALAPETEWHMTIADLVYGDGYVELFLKGQDNNLIEAIQRDPFHGIGQLVYEVLDDKIRILACRYHY